MTSYSRIISSYHPNYNIIKYHNINMYHWYYTINSITITDMINYNMYNGMITDTISYMGIIILTITDMINYNIKY